MGLFCNRYIGYCWSLESEIITDGMESPTRKPCIIVMHLEDVVREMMPVSTASFGDGANWSDGSR